MSIEFRCTWIGLKGRKIADMQPGDHWREYTSHVNERTSTVSVALDALIADTVSVAGVLAAPVLNLFDGFDLTPEWIANEVPKFRML
jgi:hypothetical protein